MFCGFYFIYFKLINFNVNVINMLSFCQIIMDILYSIFIQLINQDLSSLFFCWTRQRTNRYASATLGCYTKKCNQFF